MSWSLYTIPVPQAGKSVEQAVLEHAQGAGIAIDTDEVKDQIAAAIEAVEGLIESGAAGDGPYFADLSGHANPDHKPRPGYANDVVTVSLRQAVAS